MKKLLSLVLAVCMIVSAFGTVTAFGATASGGAGGGGSSSGGGGSVVVPSAPSGGGSSSVGSPVAEWELYSNGIECNNGSFFAGDLLLEGLVTTIDSEYDIYAVIAQYDNTGKLMRLDMNKETVSANAPFFYAALNDVSVIGRVKCMVLRADSMMPLTPSKEYSSYGRSLVIDEYNIDSGIIYKNQHGFIHYYQNETSYNTTRADIAPDAVVTINGTAINYTELDIGKYSHYFARFRLIETTGDRYFDAVSIQVYEYGVVEEVIADRERIMFLDGNRVIFDSEDPEQRADIFDKDGKRIGLEDIQPGDVLAMMVGELNYSTFVPIAAKVFSEKITIYNLGASYVEGTLNGMDDSLKMFYINGEQYQYFPGNWISDSCSSFIANIPLGVTGKFYLDITGRIIGFNGSGYDNDPYDTGFVLQAVLNQKGFQPHYQIKMLTEDNGIVIYDVDTDCTINGVYCSVNGNSDNQKLGFSKYDNITDSDKAYSRLVRFATNKNGEIDEVYFVEKCVSVNGEYVELTNKIDGRRLVDDAVVFYVANVDSEDSLSGSVSNLIDENEYKGFVCDYIGDSYNEALIVTYGEITGVEAPPVEEEPPVTEPEISQDGTGFILQSVLNQTTFSPFYQLKVLTESDGVVVFNVAEKCRIDGVRLEVDEQTALCFGKFDNVSSDAPSRVVKYSMNENGEIKEIEFVANSADIIYVNGEYDAQTNSVDDKKLDNTLIFDTSNDVDDSFVRSALEHGNRYEGTIISGGSMQKSIIIITEETICFDETGSLYVVDSAVRTIYNEDDAYLVKYYTDGEDSLKTAIFTDDSLSVFGDFNKLTKGSLFVAHITEDGFVTDYSVLATLDVNNKIYNAYDMNYAFECTYGAKASNNDVEFVYGYVYEVDRDELTICNRCYDVSNSAQYCYNTNRPVATIDVGEYDSSGFDSYDGNYANLTYLKIYDGEVTDIITFTERNAISKDNIHMPVASSLDMSIFQ